MLNTPLIWILVPVAAAGVMLLLRRWPRLTLVLGTGFALLLAWAALTAPIGEEIDPGLLAFIPGLAARLQSLTLEDSFTLLGRRFILGQSARLELSLIYFSLAFWLGGAILGRVNARFAPSAVLLTALLTAVIAVRPFLFAALLLEIAILVSIPLLAIPSRSVPPGVLRFLTQSTLGTPALLLAVWMASSTVGGTLDPTRTVQTIALLALGFALLVPFFPFHSWLPMLGGEANPYVAAFILFSIPGAVTLFGHNLLINYPWLASQAAVRDGLLLAGALMTLAGGLWAIFERNLGRMLGHAVTVQVGMTILSLALLAQRGPAIAPGIFFALFLPRAIGMALWALALVALSSQAEGLTFSEVEGLGRSTPITALSLVLAHFSLAGLPLLASFPVFMALWTALAPVSQVFTFLSIAGTAGLLIGGIRAAAALFTAPAETPWSISEPWTLLTLLLAGCLILFILGVAPHLFFPRLIALIQF